jgi:hypothetical protein
MACSRCGRHNNKLQYVVMTEALPQGGTEPGLLDQLAWWQTDDFWQHAQCAAVAYIRAAASRVGVPVRYACQRPGLPSAITTTSGHSGIGHLTVERPIITAGVCTSLETSADHAM